MLHSVFSRDPATTMSVCRRFSSSARGWKSGIRGSVQFVSSTQPSSLERHMLMKHTHINHVPRWGELHVSRAEETNTSVLKVGCNMTCAKPQLTVSFHRLI